MTEQVEAATDATSRWWRQSDRYGALLLLLVLNYLAALLVGSSAAGQPIILVLTIASLLFALHTSQVRGRVLAFAIGACGVAVVVTAVDTARNEARASVLLSVVIGLLLLATPISILRRVLGRHQIVGAETLAAALCTYLLIGLAFANLYSGVYTWEPSAMSGVTDGNRLSDLVYFSFVTLTTVGYGDILPVHDLPRSMAVTEALMGQIILVTFVGRIVSQMPAVRGVGSRPETDQVEPGPDQRGADEHTSRASDGEQARNGDDHSDDHSDDDPDRGDDPAPPQ